MPGTEKDLDTVNGFSQYAIEADLYFADFNGDWKVDNDTYFGEPGHDYDPDYYPEIFVGIELIMFIKR